MSEVWSLPESVVGVLHLAGLVWEAKPFIKKLFASERIKMQAAGQVLKVDCISGIFGIEPTPCRLEVRSLTSVKYILNIKMDPWDFKIFLTFTQVDSTISLSRSVEQYLCNDDVRRLDQRQSQTPQHTSTPLRQVRPDLEFRNCWILPWQWLVGAWF